MNLRAMMKISAALLLICWTSGAHAFSYPSLPLQGLSRRDGVTMGAAVATCQLEGAAMSRRGLLGSVLLGGLAKSLPASALDMNDIKYKAPSGPPQNVVSWTSGSQDAMPC